MIPSNDEVIYKIENGLFKRKVCFSRYNVSSEDVQKKIVFFVSKEQSEERLSVKNLEYYKYLRCIALIRKELGGITKIGFGELTKDIIEGEYSNYSGLTGYFIEIDSMTLKTNGNKLLVTKLVLMMLRAAYWKCFSDICIVALDFYQKNKSLSYHQILFLISAIALNEKKFNINNVNANHWILEKDYKGDLPYNLVDLDLYNEDYGVTANYKKTKPIGNKNLKELKEFIKNYE